MPYKSSDVPSGTEKVPGHGQAIYRGAFNAAYEKYGEEKAHAIAWAAVKHKFKKKGDEWVSKDALALPDFWSEESRIAAAEAKKAKAKEKPGSQESRARLEKAKKNYAKELRENGENHPRTVAAEREMLKAQREHGVVHRGERGGGTLKWSATGYHDRRIGDYREDQPRGKTVEGTNAGSFAPSSGGGASEGPEHAAGLTGSGGPLNSITHPGSGYSKEAYLDSSGVIHTSNVDDAARALYEDRKVELKQPDQVATLLDKLGDIAKDCINKGENAPNFDLCNVSVAGTNLFCAKPIVDERIQMPQLAPDGQPGDAEAFVKHMQAKGYKVENDTEYAAHLRATQNELKGTQVAGIAKFMETPAGQALQERPIVISRDNYILDGHHSWAAKIGIDARDNILADDKKMNVRRVDTDIVTLLYAAEEFTGGKGHKSAKDAKAMLRALNLFDIKPCPTCDGAGKDAGGMKCKTCDGEGYVKDARRMPDPDDEDECDECDDEELGDARIQMHDKFVLDGKPRKTKDGYLVARARIARTGVQEYLGSELGMHDMDVVRVYRPPSEVFSKPSMRSMATLPITLDHPPCMVNSSNWKQYAVGDTGEDVARDGECLRVPLIIKDANAIAAYERDGVRELSVGYSTDLKWQSGKTPEGETYDAVQTAIRGNHLAVVPAARGGSRLRIGDNENGGTDMIRVLIDGQSIEFHDELVAKHVQAYLASLQKTIADQKNEIGKKAAEEEQAEEKKCRAEKDAAAKDGEIAVLKKQLEDMKANRGKDIASTVELLMKANAAMDGKANFTFDTDPVLIQRAVVAHKYGEEFAKTLDASQMAGAFKVAVADIKTATGTDRLADGLSMLQFSNINPQNDPKALKDAAYAEYVKRTENAWRTPPRAA